MTAYEIADFVNELPQTGVVILDMSNDSHFIELESSSFEAVNDTTLEAVGKTTSGAFAPTSAILIDTDEVRYVKHVREGRA